MILSECHSLHILTNIRWEVKYFAQAAQIRIKGISPKQHSSAAEVFHDQLRKLQLALNHSVRMGLYSWPLYLTHFQWSISLYEDANKRKPLSSKVRLIFFFYIFTWFLHNHVPCLLFLLVKLCNVLRILQKHLNDCSVVTVTALGWRFFKFLLYEGGKKTFTHKKSTSNKNYRHVTCIIHSEYSN